MKGLVSLVGSGPGDPGLLTLKAQRRLREADLVVYDYLANPEHLRHVREGARRLCVGKRFRCHRYTQDKINRLILSHARAGRSVVRLKGGDPYLFGRGGEEALYLRQRGIPFEVIPGVTSATACAAYAGIPLTHRLHNSSVTFLTGHRAGDDGLDSIRWESLVAVGGTIVIYMGLHNLALIARRLVRAGLSGRTRAAVIEWGTLPTQRSCTGPLKDIASIVRTRKMRPPSLVIIGGVVSLSDSLGWFEKLPLFGATVLVTRMRDKCSALSERLSDWGARVVECPVLEIRPIRRAAPLDRAVRRAGQWDWVVFSSVHGVEAYFDRLDRARLDARALSGCRIACVGRETARALQARGLRADLVPPKFETTQLALALGRRLGRGIRGSKILLVRARIAPPDLEQRLRKMGAQVTRVDAYETVLPRSAGRMLERALAGPIDYVTFASSSSVKHFAALVGKGTLRRLARRARMASIGPVTSSQIVRTGLRPACQAREYTIEGLAEAVRADAAARSVRRHERR